VGAEAASTHQPGTSGGCARLIDRDPLGSQGPRRAQQQRPAVTGRSSLNWWAVVAAVLIAAGALLVVLVSIL
jgi:hypothetical protein